MNNTIETLEIIIKAKADQALQQVGKVGDAIRSTATKTKEATDKISNALPNIGTKIKQAFDGGIAKVRSYKSETSDTAKQQAFLKDKIDDIKRVLASNEKHSFLDSSEVLKEEAELEKLQRQLKKLQTEENKTEKTSEKTFKGMGNITKNLESSLNKGIKSIKRFTLSLFSIQSVMSAVSKASQSYLSMDEELNSQIDNSWKLLGSLLAPALEFVTNLFAQATSYVYEFVKALTGIDFKARANAKALKSQAKATKEASKQLSGIDDINTLSSDKNSGADTTQITSVDIGEIDATPFKKFTEDLKKILEKAFIPFKNAWNKTGGSVIKSAITSFKSLGKLISTIGKSLGKVWNNGTGEKIVENILINWGLVFDIVSNVADAISNAWENANVGTAIIQSIANIFTTIQSVVISVANTIANWTMSEGFQNAMKTIFEIAKDIFKTLEDTITWIAQMYDTYLKPVLEESLLPLIDELIAYIGNIWKIFKPVVTLTIGIIKNQLEPVIKGLSGAFGGIITTIKGILSFINGVFAGDWKKAWNGLKIIAYGIFKTLASLLATPLNMIIGGIESMINMIIKGFNLLKKSINKISFDVPDWVPVIGGDRWGFDLKLSDEISLPRLAKGNVAYSPTIAMFGEYAGAKSNPEITTPQKTMENSFRKVLSEQNNTQNNRFVINLGSKNIFDEFIDYVNEKSSRNGVSVFKEV